MDEEQSIDKIDKEVKRHIQPLYTVWCEKAHLTEIEKRILYLKEFDYRKLNEYEQIDILKKAVSDDCLFIYKYTTYIILVKK